MELNLVGAFDGKNYRVFRDMRSFYAFTLHKRYEGWRWFAHNGGKFDIRFILESLHKVHPRINFHFNMSGSAIINLTVEKGRAKKKRRWYFVDSYRLMQASLDKLTKQFDVAHKKLDFAPDDIEYNKNDCIGLYEVLVEFFKLHGICSETIASHAMKVFRTNYLKKKLPVPHEDVEEFVRSSYYGGRCEIFRYDRERLDLYDINSMYPWAMKHLMPVEYRCRSTEIPDSDEQGIGFYEAQVEYPEVYAPCLPWYHDKLYFPMGRMVVRASSMELRQAISDGAKVKILRGCVFNVDYLFSEYVEDIYKMKSEAKARGDKAVEYIAKLLLNSLYGKFGQRRDQVSYALDPGTVFLDGDEGPRVWPVGTNGEICFYKSTSTSAHILPHIAATITARARLLLLEFIRNAGEGVWYTDTDSVFTNKSLPSSPDLGQMAFEGNGIFQAFGVKEYVFKMADGIKPSLKGVSLTKTDPKTGKRTQDLSLMERYLSIEPVNDRRMSGILSSLKAGKSTLRYIDTVRMKHVVFPKRAPVGEIHTRPWTPDEIVDKTVRKRILAIPPKSIERGFLTQGV